MLIRPMLVGTIMLASCFLFSAAGCGSSAAPPSPPQEDNAGPEIEAGRSVQPEEEPELPPIPPEPIEGPLGGPLD